MAKQLRPDPIKSQQAESSNNSNTDRIKPIKFYYRMLSTNYLSTNFKYLC